MKKAPTAWAIQRPDKTILTDMVRSTRSGAIQAICSHIRPHESSAPWQWLSRRGFKVVKVTVALMLAETQ